MKKAFKISLVLIPVIIAVLVFSFVNTTLNRPYIYSGVRVEGMDIGEMDENQARDYLRENLDDSLGKRQITLKTDQYIKTVNYSDLDIKYDYDSALSQAYNVGREGDTISKLKEIYRVSKEGKDIDLEITKNIEKINKLTESVNEELHKDSKDATLKFSSGNFIVTKEFVGQSVDKEKLNSDIDKGIEAGEEVVVELRSETPRVTSALLNRVTEEVGTYTTEFKLDDANRVFNVTRAANSVDGKLVLPGETFSFNKTTGPRSLKAGYKEATVISNGEFVPGEGGGVCQVSSTLYNTLLNSGMKIVERHTHSLPISYVPKGRDATVSYNALDLRFKNNYDAPVYIQSYVSGNTLTVKMYGDKNANKIN